MNCMQHFIVRHYTDVMHVEKNVCENVVKTIFGDDKGPVAVWTSYNNHAIIADFEEYLCKNRGP
jgi:hypothetical protein